MDGRRHVNMIIKPPQRITILTQENDLNHVSDINLATDRLLKIIAFLQQMSGPTQRRYSLNS
jgi:hypothetical protein